MIRKRIKKIYKLSILIAVRQIWKLVENLYHLVNQPFLTIKELIRTKDKSQIFLLGMTVTSPGILYLSARLLWDWYRFKHLVPAVGGFFKLVIIIETIVFVYIGYWAFRAFKKND